MKSVNFLQRMYLLYKEHHCARNKILPALHIQVDLHKRHIELTNSLNEKNKDDRSSSAEVYYNLDLHNNFR